MCPNIQIFISRRSEITCCLISSTERRPSIPRSLHAVRSSASERESIPSIWIIRSSFLILIQVKNAQLLKMRPWSDKIKLLYEAGALLFTLNKTLHDNMLSIPCMTSRFRIPYMTIKSSISYTLNKFPLEVLYSRVQSPSITNQYMVDLL